MRKFLGMLMVSLLILVTLGVHPISAATTISVWIPGGVPDWFREAITRFGKKCPDIKVNVMSVPWETIVDKFLVSVAGGTPPDVFMYGAGGVITFAASDLLMPLDSLLLRANFDAKSQIFPGYLEPATWQGKVFGIPLSAHIAMLLRYCPIFDAVGIDPMVEIKTWEELGIIAQRLSLWSGGNMVRTGLTLPYTGPSVMHVFMTLFRQYGGEPFSEDGKRVLFDSVPGRRAMEIYAAMFQKYKVWVPGAPGGLGSGKVAMAWGGYEGIKGLEKNYPEIGEDIVLMPLPTQGVRAFYGGGTTMMIPKGAKHPKEAFEFMMFLIEPDIARLQVEANGQLPPRRVLLEADWARRDRNLAINIRNFEFARTSPPHPDWVTILPHIEKAIPPALKGEVPPDRAVEDMARNCNATMEAKRKQQK